MQIQLQAKLSFKECALINIFTCPVHIYPIVISPPSPLGDLRSNPHVLESPSLLLSWTLSSGLFPCKNGIAFCHTRRITWESTTIEKVRAPVLLILEGSCSTPLPPRALVKNFRDTTAITVVSDELTLSKGP